MVDDNQYNNDLDIMNGPPGPWPVVGLPPPPPPPNLEPPPRYEAVDMKPSGLPLCSCERCSSMDSEFNKPAKFAGYSQINPYKVDGLTEHQNFICCRDTYAFVFKIRQWSKSISGEEWSLDRSAPVHMTKFSQGGYFSPVSASLSLTRN